MIARWVYMDEKNEMGNQERMQTLLQEISSLNKENQRLRKLLEDNGIILKEKVREPMRVFDTPKR